MRITGHDEGGQRDGGGIRIPHRRPASREEDLPRDRAGRTHPCGQVRRSLFASRFRGRAWVEGLDRPLLDDPCAKRNGSVVITVHGGWLPPSVGGYPGRIQLSPTAGAREARDPLTSCTDGWVPLDEFLGRSQLDGNVGVHTVSEVAPRDVVRTYKRQHWVYWQLGLTDGSRYDVKSFTITTPYYVLIPSTSRTANDAKTMAEPSGAPGPRYTVPKTDAAEFPAAYRPAR